MKKILLILLMTAWANACKKDAANGAPVPPTATTLSSFVKGADVSWITQMEASAVKFYNGNGAAQEGIALLKASGINTIRLRVWVNPSPAWNDANDVLAKALRAKNLGLRILIDFHYSDSWADPGKQTKPAAWSTQDVEGLIASVSSHTATVLTLLKNNNIIPEWVQAGNETNDGMLWPEGRASTNMNNFARLINASYDAVKSVFPSAKVIVHISNGYNNSLFRWMFDGMVQQGARFDVIGMSLYPSATNWPSYTAQCLANMNDMVARYNKEVMIVEAGMPWDNAAAAHAFLVDLITKTKSVSGSKGLGVLYWEPEAYNNWQGYALGAFDNSGKPTLAMSAFSD